MSISQSLYNQIMMADNFTCVYCGLRTPEVEVDHIIPQSVGGPDVLHNLVAACPACNARKRDHQLYEVRMFLQWGRFNVKPLPRKIRATPPVALRDGRKERIQELAAERNEEGWYKFSANAICKFVGGARSPIMAEVAAVRTGQPANTRMKQQLKAIDEVAS
jgi:hypothetical protein